VLIQKQEEFEIEINKLNELNERKITDAEVKNA